jgi:hypothetical protein
VLWRLIKVIFKGFNMNKKFVALDAETRTSITTDEAAFHLNRKAQTLRTWACFGIGPIKPVRINGRLSWKVSDIKSLLNGDI